MPAQRVSSIHQIGGRTEALPHVVVQPGSQRSRVLLLYRYLGCARLQETWTVQTASPPAFPQRHDKSCRVIGTRSEWATILPWLSTLPRTPVSGQLQGLQPRGGINPSSVRVGDDPPGAGTGTSVVRGKKPAK